MSYDFNQSIKTNSYSQSSVCIAIVTGFTFTKYNGMDPEVGQGRESYMMGSETGFVPNPRTIIFGVNIKL